MQFLGFLGQFLQTFPIFARIDVTKTMKVSVEKYVSPEVVEYEMLSEGVLCGSNEGLGETPGNPWDQNLYGHDLY